MENTIQLYLPQPNSPEEKFTILSKNTKLNNLNYLGVTSHTGSFESLQETYLDLPREQQEYYIVTEKFATELTAQSVGKSDNDKFSQEQIAQIINYTQQSLSMTVEPVLTEEEIIAKRKKEEEELAQQLGLIPNPESYISQFLPKENEPDTTFSVIAKNKNNGNLQDMTVIDNDFSLSFKEANKISSILDKQNNSELEYFIVTSKFAQQLQSLSNSTILDGVNKTQAIIGSSKTIMPAPVVAANVESPKNKITPPKLSEILAKTDIDTPKVADQPVVPTPETINNNYKPLGETLKMFANEKANAKLKKSPISKKLVLTTVGLVGVGILSMSLSPIVIPAAFLVGTIAVAKAKFGYGDKAEVKLWNKREKLLKQAALQHVAGDFDGKIDIKGVEQIALTPEIEKAYRELCKKANISAINVSVEKIRDNSHSSQQNNNMPKRK